MIPRTNFYDIFKHLIAKLKWLIGKAFILTFIIFNKSVFINLLNLKFVNLLKRIYFYNI